MISLYPGKKSQLCPLPYQEYGLSTAEKIKIGANIATPLMRKIKADLLTNAQEGEDYTRLDSRYAL